MVNDLISVNFHVLFLCLYCNFCSLLFCTLCYALYMGLHCKVLYKDGCFIMLTSACIIKLKTKCDKSGIVELITRKLHSCIFLPLLSGKDDIVDGNVRLILGLVWQMICHYSSFGERRIAALRRESKKADPRGTLLTWVNKTSTLHITNLTTDWNDGRAIGALVNALAPGKSHTARF